MIFCRIHTELSEPGPGLILATKITLKPFWWWFEETSFQRS